MNILKLISHSLKSLTALLVQIGNTYRTKKSLYVKCALKVYDKCQAPIYKLTPCVLVFIESEGVEHVGLGVRQRENKIGLVRDGIGQNNTTFFNPLVIAAKTQFPLLPLLSCSLFSSSLSVLRHSLILLPSVPSPPPQSTFLTQSGEWLTPWSQYAARSWVH